MRLNALWMLGVLILLSGCYPEGAEFADELDLVVSLENKEVNYDNYQSFFMEERVVVLSNADEEEFLDADQAEFLTSELKGRLFEYGWTEADTAVDTPDAVVLITVLENVNVDVVGGGWGWGSWGGWGYWGGYPSGGYYPWYPGYPGYCCYTSIYAYTTGSIIIEMLDPAMAIQEGDNDPDPMPVVWGGGINGYLEGSVSNRRARVRSGLDQMFEDSPYLNNN